MARFSVCRRVSLAASAGLALAACLKTLDASRIPDGTDANGGASGVGGDEASAGSGGTTGGTGGNAAGGGSGGNAGQGGTGGTADAGLTFVAHDPGVFPLLLDIQGSLTPPVLIAADATHAYRVTEGATSEPRALIVAVDIAARDGVALRAIDGPQALIAPLSSRFVFVAAGQGATSLGAVWRVDKQDGANSEQIQLPSGASMEPAVAIVEGSASAPNTAFVAARASGPGKVVLLRVPFAATTGEVMFESTKPESGGDLVEMAGCVYFISENNIWLLPTTSSGGRDPEPALQTPVNNAVGITADATNFYYTLANGEIWQRPLAPPACDSSAPPEQKVVSGFAGIGDVLTFDGKLVWRASNYVPADSGAGIFMYELGGTTITQIAAGDGNPDNLAFNPTLLLFTTNEPADRSRVRQMKRP